jgi:hypothetical protein
MHARLVADLNQAIEVGEQRAPALDDGILRFPRQVRSVEIEDVVILDIALQRTARALVPRGLIDTASDQTSLWHPKQRQSLQDRAVDRVSQGGADEIHCGATLLGRVREKPVFVPPFRSCRSRSMCA